MLNAVLVVDDEEDVRFLFTQQLKKLGVMAVATAANGHEALQISAKVAFDLILTDTDMPTVDGLSFIALLRGAGLVTPVILISGRLDAELSARAIAVGANAVLMKPWKIQGLKDAIAQALMACEPPAHVVQDDVGEGPFGD